MPRTLFDDQQPEPGPSRREEAVSQSAPDPLAERMRPRSLAEVVGHREVLGEGGFLRRAIAADRVPSLIFWGPPGSGKTTLARLIATETASHFVPFSAVTSGIKEVKEVMAEAVRLRKAQGRRTLLFVDEIHRFNRAQQDAFLPYVERGDVVLVGATTENPSFELNAALLSRCRVVVLEALSEEDLVGLMRRALQDSERGLGKSGIEADDEALASLAGLASGDARRALNLLELAVADATSSGETLIDGAAVQRLAQRKILLYDKSGEEHFNLISALHKSLRDSDADGALYWLTRMLAAGEDPRYLARRMVRFASEDVGLADPQALPLTLAAWDAYQRLGSPEGELALAEAALYLALAPKSNAVYAAYGQARRTVEERPADPVPMSIRNAPTGLMKGLGYGKGYVYAHDTEEGTGGLDCLPDSLQGTHFYEPRASGFEAELKERLERMRELRESAKKKRKG
ncbi:MAG TPA: replication-associated recombination protein A [Thermoanaerobaculia bacterium]|jgi:putative ATPase|nr:replication-associated recombination protein A [Thermoanaerobaculia bacterium]